MVKKLEGDYYESMENKERTKRMVNFLYDNRQENFVQPPFKHHICVRTSLTSLNKRVTQNIILLL